MSRIITDADFAAQSAKHNIGEAELRAVAQVEAPKGPYDENGLPTILFEGHWFHKFTEGKFDAEHPTISYPTWTKRFYTGSNTREHGRLAEATALDREAGLKSASWGAFQIMGFNHKDAGHDTIQDFVNAMYESPGAQFDAFMSFLKKYRGGILLPALREHRWANFAEAYNGSGYAANKYDLKLAQAYKGFK